MKKLKSVFGLRSKWFIIQKTNLIVEDLLQNVLLILCSTCAFLFAQEFHTSNNIINKLLKSVTNGNNNTHHENYLDTSEFFMFADTIQYTLYIFNNVSCAISVTICVLWFLTTNSDRKFWTNCRFFISSISAFGYIVILICFLFTIQLENLMKLKFSEDNFATQNDKVQEYANLAMKVSINGSALSAISFVIVYIIYSVSGGIFTGVTLYLVTHVKNETQISSTVTSWIMTLTIVQSIVSLHPTIIWSQRSTSKLIYLGFSVIIWFMPIVFHQISRPIVYIINKLCSTCTNKSEGSVVDNQWNLHKSRKGTVKSIAKKYFYAFICLSFFSCFIASFIYLTKIIVAKDMDDGHDFIKSYVYTCIATMFTWTASCTYYLLYLTYCKCFNTLIKCTCDSNPNISYHQQLELVSSVNLCKKDSSTHKENSKLKTFLSRKPSNSCVLNIKSIVGKLFNFAFESNEYSNPSKYGWRIRLRRIYSWVGSICFTYVAFVNFNSTATFSSKTEIQNLLNRFDANLTWPEDRSSIDDVFDLYNETQIVKSYAMVIAAVLFISSLIFDSVSFLCTKKYLIRVCCLLYALKSLELG